MATALTLYGHTFCNFITSTAGWVAFLRLREVFLIQQVKPRYLRHSYDFFLRKQSEHALHLKALLGLRSNEVYIWDEEQKGISEKDITRL